MRGLRGCVCVRVYILHLYLYVRTHALRESVFPNLLTRKQQRQVRCCNFCPSVCWNNVGDTMNARGCGRHPRAKGSSRNMFTFKRKMRCQVHLKIMLAALKCCQHHMQFLCTLSVALCTADQQLPNFVPRNTFFKTKVTKKDIKPAF